MTKKLLLLVFPLLLGGCSVFSPFKAPDPEKTASYILESEREWTPVVITCPENGPPSVHVVPVPASEKKQASAEQTETQPKLTLWGKIKRGIAVMGAVGVLILIAAFVFPPFGSVLLYLWRKFVSWRRAAKETWRGIEIAEGEKCRKDAELAQALGDIQSDKTKQRVKLARAKGELK